MADHARAVPPIRMRDEAEQWVEVRAAQVGRLSKEHLEAQKLEKGSFIAVALGVALLSYAVLTLEIALTRVFSVMVDYHSAFAIMSAAVLGLGLGGLAHKWCGKVKIPMTPCLCAVLFAVSAVLSLILIVMVPDFGTASFGLRIALAAVPFLAAGMALSRAFQENAARSSPLYAADLGGAALAAVVAVPSLDALGAPATISLAASVAALGAVSLGWAARRKLRPALVTGVAILLVVVLASGRAAIPVPVANDADKEMHLILSDPTYQARIRESHWGAFGRTDVVESPLTPNQRILFVDGAAGAVMYHLDGAWKERREISGVAVPYAVYLPLRLLPNERKQKAWVIGAGGGRDVVVALLAGVKEVTAIEVNPEIVRTVRDSADWNGGIYSDDPDVRVVVAEGRSFVKSTDERNDVIVLALPVTKSSRSVEGYALTENYLFTVEAFDDYLDHLNDNGSIVAITHNEVEIYRLLAVAAQSFTRRGISEREFMRHVYTLPTDPMPTLVVEKQPITAEAADAVRGALHKLRLDRAPFYVPCVSRQGNPCHDLDGPPIERRLLDVAEGRATFAALSDLSTYDISPVNDDRPFFFDLERGLPRPLGVFAILLVFGFAGLACCATASFWPRRPPSRGAHGRRPLTMRLVLVFMLLGAGYMLVEVALFQKLMLFIGEPQKALTVLLFSLLLGSGIGALTSHAIQRAPAKMAARVSIAVSGVVLLLALTIGKVFESGLPPQLTGVLTLVPLGFLMGMPFPFSVRLAHSHSLSDRVACLWGANSVASVLGAVAAMVIAHMAGFTWALVTGATLYLVAALTFKALSPEIPRDALAHQ